jgi:hypothetical protein
MGGITRGRGKLILKAVVWVDCEGKYCFVQFIYFYNKATNFNYTKKFTVRFSPECVINCYVLYPFSFPV